MKTPKNQRKKNVERLLIVDDEPVNLKVLGNVLKDDYEIVFATNSEEALRVLERHKIPDLILLDIMMPGMDGYDLCMKLKKNEVTRDIPLIFITAKRDEEDETKGFELGAVDYITKPFNPSVVKARVSNHLELKKHRETLEELIRERTTSLVIANEQLKKEILERVRTEEELLKAKEAAEGANKAKTQFLANMSHEVRTPLTGIMGNINLLIGTKLSQEQLDYAEVIRTSSDFLHSLINDILDFSKLEAGQLHLELQDFNLEQLVKEVTEILSVKINEKNLNFKVDIDSCIPGMVKGDAGRLKQILINLVHNAVKYTDRGEIVVVISRMEDKDRMIKIKFSIKDTGIGIPKKRLGSLFKYFSQVDSSMSRKYGGAGLGLAISKQLCEQMGGTIGVVSKEGKGSTFWFIVLLEKSEMNGDSEISIVENRTKEVCLYNKNTIRILVVEDNVVNLKLAVKILTKKGFNAEGVVNGIEAVEALSTKKYDLVLMDVQMPLMDGFEATRIIREPMSGVLNHDIPIIALTAHAMKGDREKCMEAGMNDYLSKPIRPEKLEETIEKYILMDIAKQ